MEAHSPDFNPMVLFVALLLIVAFTAIFYQRHQWDQYEQHYQELRARLQKEESASKAAPSTQLVEPTDPIETRPADPALTPPNDAITPPDLNKLKKSIFFNSLAALPCSRLSTLSREREHSTQTSREQRS
jgi:hypothetical protein